MSANRDDPMDGSYFPETATVELVRDLVRIPSVNPSLAPDEGDGEAALAKFAHDWLVSRGAPARLEEAAPGRPNVVAEIGSDGPTLILCGHLDTVSARGMEIPPFEPHFQDGRIYGRGAYDMKGGVAAAMLATAALAGQDPFQGRVTLALVVDEEDRSIGADRFVERHYGDACIVTEPTEERLVLTHKGFAWGRVVARGRAAHGSRPDLGVSAIHKMAHVVTALDRYDRETLRARVDPLLGPASLHCSVIEGGTGVSTYAAECRLQLERRTLPGEIYEEVIGDLRRVVAEVAPDAQVDFYFRRDPLICGRDEPIARILREAALDVKGAEPEEAGVAYWTDAAIFDSAGIPALNYGPAGEGAHGAVEWVDVASVSNCARVLANAAIRFGSLSR